MGGAGQNGGGAQQVLSHQKGGTKKFSTNKEGGHKKVLTKFTHNYRKIAKFSSRYAHIYSYITKVS